MSYYNPMTQKFYTRKEWEDHRICPKCKSHFTTKRTGDFEGELDYFCIDCCSYFDGNEGV